MVAFDRKDLDAAHAELDRRFEAGEGAEVATRIAARELSVSLVANSRSRQPSARRRAGAPATGTVSLTRWSRASASTTAESLSHVVLDLDAYVLFARALGDMASASIHVDYLATRGESSVSGGNSPTVAEGDVGPSDLEYLYVVEADEHGRTVSAGGVRQQRSGLRLCRAGSALRSSRRCRRRERAPPCAGRNRARVVRTDREEESRDGLDGTRLGGHRRSDFRSHRDDGRSGSLAIRSGARVGGSPADRGPLGRGRSLHGIVARATRFRGASRRPRDRRYSGRPRRDCASVVGGRSAGRRLRGRDARRDSR